MTFVLAVLGHSGGAWFTRGLPTGQSFRGSVRVFRFLPDENPSDLAHAMLYPAAAIRAIVHGALMRLDQERRSGRDRRETVLSADSGELVIVPGSPVDVYPAGHAVPFGIRNRGAALGTCHGPAHRRHPMGRPCQAD